MDDRWCSFRPDQALATPLYLQVARKLSEAINAGHWRADEALPSERALSEELGISRVTTRRALDLLLEQGLIRRRHGSGTFITPRAEQSLSRLTSFTEFLKMRGFEPSSVWLERAVCSPNHDEAIKLGLPSGAQVVRLKRQRLADGMVMAIEQSTLPLEYLPAPEAIGSSLYAWLEEAGTPVVRAIQHISAVNAGPDIAALTGIRPEEAMLLMSRIGYAANGVAIELTDTWCRNDFYDFVAELVR